MIVVAVRDLLFRSKISAAAERLAVPIVLAPRDRPLADVVREAPGASVLADLNQPGMVGELAALKRDTGARVLGFLGHLQADLIEAAEAAGVDEVMTRGQLTGRLDEVLRRG
ncbi:hypothetical protein [Anaeromyxobacter terrae]|uniref:hypothetical protein n=1 Tax=Anaeromyxobacter terrae TaxID=2925406 RepID=UPI001F597386|nr:hypothetical protein [Anaeromyxobacter sp. SG22]